ncbi:hypothetical protein CBR_g1114 [Chara braunii]|uniref:Uncharacterized protein n=1 Tax=Chara braunii TaxID=69332 RepID=A0A388KD65_CHABU|nr:hypothetical protein CBR_g1114 [Chara braunii]|eukprot:GBG67995.1 hypothetical protein CBR_g1114 [Chara braunii]
MVGASRSMLHAGWRRLKELTASLFSPDLARCDIDGGTISHVGWVKAVMLEMLEVIGELEEECYFHPAALSDKSQMDTLMSECNDSFEKGCTQGVLLVKSWGGELPASMVADGHFLLDRPPLPSQAESTSTLSMEVSDPLYTMDFLDDPTSTIGATSQITTAIPTTISATATIPLCTMGILDNMTSTTGAESRIITAISITTSATAKIAPVCITEISNEPAAFFVQRVAPVGISMISNGARVLNNQASTTSSKEAPPTATGIMKTSDGPGELLDTPKTTQALVDSKKTSDGPAELFNFQSTTQAPRGITQSAERGRILYQQFFLLSVGEYFESFQATRLGQENEWLIAWGAACLCARYIVGEQGAGRWREGVG